MSERVREALEDGVLTLTLHRPEKRNAIDSAMVEELHAALDRADLDGNVRVVAIRGAGKDFCAGADLAELLDSVERAPGENAASALRLGEIFLRIRRLPRPVVALVHGRALAGGCGLATACDLVLADAGARFGYPEVHRGFVPAMVMAVLRRIVPERVAFDLLATGRLLTAHEARELGLVARVADPADFEKDSAALLRSLAGVSPSALALIKRQLYALDGRDLEAGIRLGAEVNALARATPDFRAAVATFLKR